VFVSFTDERHLRTELINNGKIILQFKITVKNVIVDMACHAVSKRNATIMKYFHHIIDVCDNVCKWK
jgi:hypothetical protein